MQINFGSVCSGIEAASVAWEPIGFNPAWFSEIEHFPSSLLGYHWPDIDNLGDMTLIRDKIKTGSVLAPSILVGGTPCQAFSVAGLRNSLEDNRGQLTLEFVKLADEIDEKRKQLGRPESIVVWENVPGVLSTKDNAFGCFLGALAGEDCELQPSGKKWTNAGCVSGPKRAVAWRVLDAQYFGVAQRRRRVFVIASARDGFDPCKVLFESEGLRRDSAPRREEGKEIAENSGSGFTNTGFARYRAGVGTLKASGGDIGGGSETLAVFNKQRIGQYSDEDIASTCAARDYKDATDLVVNPCYPITDKATRHSGKTGVGSGNGLGIGKDGDPSPTLTAGDKHAVFHAGFSNVSGCLTSSYATKWNGNSSATSGDLFAYTVHGTQDLCSQKERAFALGRNNGAENAVFEVRPINTMTVQGRPSDNGRMGSGIGESNQPQNTLSTAHHHGVFDSRFMAVRRLTPVECERLQGFPDNHTKIPWRGKFPEDCPDGPRYKAIGNSMAVPVMRWIGERILNAIKQLDNRSNKLDNN